MKRTRVLVEIKSEPCHIPWLALHLCDILSKIYTWFIAVTTEWKKPEPQVYVFPENLEFRWFENLIWSQETPLFSQPTRFRYVLTQYIVQVLLFTQKQVNLFKTKSLFFSRVNHLSICTLIILSIIDLNCQHLKELKCCLF